MAITERKKSVLKFALMHKTQVTCSGSCPRVPMIMHRFPVFPHTALLSTVCHGSNEGGCYPRLFHHLGFVDNRIKICAIIASLTAQGRKLDKKINLTAKKGFSTYAIGKSNLDLIACKMKDIISKIDRQREVTKTLINLIDGGGPHRLDNLRGKLSYRSVGLPGTFSPL